MKQTNMLVLEVRLLARSETASYFI